MTDHGHSHCHIDLVGVGRDSDLELLGIILLYSLIMTQFFDFANPWTILLISLIIQLLARIQSIIPFVSLPYNHRIEWRIKHNSPPPILFSPCRSATSEWAHRASSSKINNSLVVVGRSKEYSRNSSYNMIKRKHSQFFFKHIICRCMILIRTKWRPI